MREDFKNVTINHGVDAFECVDANNRDDALIKRIIDIANNPHWEICCSNKNTYIGPIGISCVGDVIAAYAKDVASEYDDNGHRYIPYPIDEPECSLTAWNKAYESEAWVSNTVIESIWITDGLAYRLYKTGKLSQFLALGYQVNIIPGTGAYSIEEVMLYTHKQEVYDMLTEIDKYIKAYFN